MEKRNTQPPKEQREDIAVGRRGVLELLHTQKEIQTIFVEKGERKGSIVQILAEARQRGIPVKEVSAQKLSFLCGGEDHQGVAAQMAFGRYSELSDIFERAQQSGQPPFIVLADDIEDPHNLGAIIRTAEGAGAHGLIMPKRHGVGLTYAVSKTSAGAVEHLPVVRVPNLVQTIEELKKKNIWVYCADMNGTRWCDVDYSGGVALVVGAEGRGVSRLVREKCDVCVSLPMNGKVSSLNASVAAGIIMYEIARQRA